MPFPSLEFLLFFLPAVLLLYLACSFSRLTQNLCLLAASLFFYAWGEPVYVLFLLASIAVNYCLGLALLRPRTVLFKKMLVGIAVALNLGILLAGRYGGGWLDSLSGVIGVRLLPELTAAPLGISFFTLQALSYILDICRGKATAEKNIVSVGLFISLFPTVLAGPILRYGDLARQITNRTASPGLVFAGCSRFVIGMAKQVLIAGSLGLVADNVFYLSALGASNAAVPVSLALLGLLAFSLYLYFSFSGFSDMAIGLAGMFGFKLQENFNYPYAARSLTEFWQRWHISLFRWFYLYVFLPLGGARPIQVRRQGQIKMHNFLVRNLFVMWLLIGLWHGLNWTYVLLGMWFFTIYLFEWAIRISKRKLANPCWRLYLFLVIGVAWVFYRCATVGESMTFLSNLFGLNGNGFFSGFALVLLRENWLPLLLGVIFSAPVGRSVDKYLRSDRQGPVRWLTGFGYAAVLTALFCLSVIFLGRGGPPPSIFM